MTNDPIVAEVRAARDAYAAKFNYNLRAMFADLREKTAQSEKKPVQLPAKRMTKRSMRKKPA